VTERRTYQGAFMAKDPTGALREGMALGFWSLDELWVAMFGLGGNLTTSALAAIVSGSRPTTKREYELLQIALNEHLDDLGLDPSVAEWRHLPDHAA